MGAMLTVPVATFPRVCGCRSKSIASMGRSYANP